MNPPASLTGSHLRTWQTIFQNPVSCNLGWQDVVALLRLLGRVEDESNGDLTATHNGRTLVLHPSRDQDVAKTDELVDLRRFLTPGEPVRPGASDGEDHWLLVIDHHEARIYRSEMRGSVPERILPHEPDDYFRHTHNSKDFSRGKEKPDPNSFFGPVAAALQAAGHILVFGRGTGKSNEMDQFIAWARFHHPALARRIIGSLVVDEHHLSAGQLLAKAREFYLHAPHPFLPFNRP